ncbi:hypothetical protein [Azotobacter chroococcum]|uniref:Uncharacterized protein n=1 Tax=Azotobacter chroococcum TaxID=353 RepID=A0AAP9Y9Y6_9GAMM|nr:hypothetical protein [Azotobacter chroococcum]QQE86943.1 hypothetical protein GKQ51_11410 [Azotobacter chroococcum]
MARRRKRPSLEAWLFSVVGTFATVYLGHQAIVGHIHRVTDRQIAQSQETLRRIQQQQMERQQQARQPVYQHQAQQLVSQQAHAHPPRQQAVSDQEIQLERERVAQQIESVRQRAELDQRKDEAWERFFTPTRACTQPESPTRIEVCSAREARFRKEFAQRWAAGELSHPEA